MNKSLVMRRGCLCTEGIILKVVIINNHTITQQIINTKKLYSYFIKQCKVMKRCDSYQNRDVNATWQEPHISTNIFQYQHILYTTSHCEIEPIKQLQSKYKQKSNGDNDNTTKLVHKRQQRVKTVEITVCCCCSVNSEMLHETINLVLQGGQSAMKRE